MKTILEFTLPEESTELKLAQNGHAYHNILWELRNEIRVMIKHGHPHKTADDAINYINDRLHDLLSDNNCTFEI